VSVTVPHSGQTLHELDWQSLREPNLKNAVSFQYNWLGAERLFTQTSVRLAADGLSCSLGYPILVVRALRFRQRASASVRWGPYGKLGPIRQN
jgi:hypothetical protein